MTTSEHLATPSGRRDATRAALAMGPTNTAGQGFQWTQALTRFRGVDAISLSGAIGQARKISGPAHRRVPHHRIRPLAVRAAWTKRLLRGRSHLIDESMVAILGDPRTSDFAAEVPQLQDLGLTLGVVFHGSDIRDPDRHMSRLPFSYFASASDDFVERMRRTTAARHAARDALGMPTFVSTPDLLLDVPDATWLPVVVDAGMWASDRPVLAATTPRVMHIPSRRDPPIKGTAHIDPVLRRLESEGLIEYISPTMVPHEQMPSLVGEVDVVVDQIMSGFAGVAAAEGMAAGRVVVGYIAPDVRDVMPTRSPVVDAPPDEFEATMRRILAERETFVEIAALGPGYVDEVHSGRLSAHVLAAFMGLPPE